MVIVPILDAGSPARDVYSREKTNLFQIPLHGQHGMDTTVSSGAMETHCPTAIIVSVDTGRAPASMRALIASNFVSEYDSECDT